MTRTFLIGVAVIVLGWAGFAFLSSQKAENNAMMQDESVMTEKTESDTMMKDEPAMMQESDGAH